MERVRQLVDEQVDLLLALTQVINSIAEISHLHRLISNLKKLTDADEDENTDSEEFPPNQEQFFKNIKVSIFYLCFFFTEKKYDARAHIGNRF